MDQKNKINDLSFDNIIKQQHILNSYVKTNKMSENEIIKILDVVDLEMLLKHQKMSCEFIKSNILDRINDDNKNITKEKICFWQDILLSDL